MLISSGRDSLFRQGSLRQVIIYNYNNKSNEKKVKVKETDSSWSQNWLLPAINRGTYCHSNLFLMEAQ